MELFATRGFRWDRALLPREIPRASVERAVFRHHRMLPEYVWDAGVLEGNPFTFPEVKALIDGVTVGGHKLSDQEQILNLVEGSRRLLALVAERKFALDKPTSCELHARVARNEALEWGHFRGEGQETRFTPDVALASAGSLHAVADRSRGDPAQSGVHARGGCPEGAGGDALREGAGVFSSAPCSSSSLTVTSVARAS